MHKTLRQREAAADARLGKTFCHIDLGGGDAPDNSGLNAAAIKQADLSAEQLAWAKQLWAETAPQRAEAQARQNAISDAQLSLMRKAESTADEAAGRYRSTFQPVEDRMVRDAMGYDTPLRREQEAGQAMADVGSQGDIVRADILRELQSRGVDASSGNAAAALAQSAPALAAAKAAAGNTARKQVETISAAKLADAANLGRGIASNNATQAGIALNAGNSSATNAAGANATGMSAAPVMQSAYSGAQSGLAGAANTYGTIGQINNQYNQQQGQAAAGLGKLAGTAAMLMISDENEKDTKQPLDDEDAMVALRRVPVSSWKYKRGSHADDGGQRHVGPMAQDVQRAMGDAVAPAGKAIDLVSANGVTMAAVRHVDKRTSALEREVVALRHAMRGKKNPVARKHAPARMSSASADDGE